LWGLHYQRVRNALLMVMGARYPISGLIV